MLEGHIASLDGFHEEQLISKCHDYHIRMYQVCSDMWSYHESGQIYVKGHTVSEGTLVQKVVLPPQSSVFSDFHPKLLVSGMSAWPLGLNGVWMCVYIINNTLVNKLINDN